MSEPLLKPVTHICAGKVGHHLFRWWLIAWSAPSRYLNQCWNIVNWTRRNNFQRNFDRKSNIFIQQNAFEDVFCEMAVILSRSQCVNNWWSSDAYLLSSANWATVGLNKGWFLIPCEGNIGTGVYISLITLHWSDLIKVLPGVFRCFCMTSYITIFKGNSPTIDLFWFKNSFKL